MRANLDPAVAAVQDFLRPLISSAVKATEKAVLTKLLEDPEQLPAACYAFHATLFGYSQGGLHDILEDLEGQSQLGYLTRDSAYSLGEYMRETGRWHKHERLDDLVGRLI